jgi:hypothetical protein
MKFELGDEVEFVYDIVIQGIKYHTGDSVQIIGKDYFPNSYDIIGLHPQWAFGVPGTLLDSVCSIKGTTTLPVGTYPSLTLNDVNKMVDGAMDFYGVDQLQTNSKNKCECGCTSVGSDRHSDWCPLYLKVV